MNPSMTDLSFDPDFYFCPSFPCSCSSSSPSPFSLLRDLSLRFLRERESDRLLRFLERDRHLLRPSRLLDRFLDLERFLPDPLSLLLLRPFLSSPFFSSFTFFSSSIFK